MKKYLIIIATATAILTGLFLSLNGKWNDTNTISADSTENNYTPKIMPDGKQWTTLNLNIVLPQSYCYNDSDSNCRRYGRLYTWEAAQKGCPLMGDGWRLPTNDEWEKLALYYGGVHNNDSARSGTGAYNALLEGGASGFNVVFGGNRDPGGEYARIEAHGFYWTSTETGTSNAWLYNFGSGSGFLNRHKDGEKERAFSVRCIRDN
jgi:uncharacterized protein (TIGR02145 family)